MFLNLMCKPASLTAIAMALLTSAAFAKPHVVLAQLTWDEPRAVDAVLQVIIEKHLDAQARMIADDQPAIFAALSKGAGQVASHHAIWSAAQGTNNHNNIKKPN